MLLHTAFSSLIGLLLLYTPGYFLLKTTNFRQLHSVALAPLITIGLASFIGLLLEKAGIFVAPYLLFIVPAILACIAYGATKRPVESLKLARQRSRDLGFLALYIGISALAGYFLFLRILPSFDAFSQTWDNVTHMTLVQNFAANGNCSPFAVSHYSPGSLTPYGVDSGSSNFYPVAWHVFAAALSSLLAIPAGAAETVANFIFAFVVFPVSTYGFIKYLTHNNTYALIAGGLLTPGFAIFPYRLLVWTPCFPNLAGFALVPAIIVSFMSILDWHLTSRQRISYGILFAIGVFSLMLLHPNAVFTAATIMIPYCVYTAYRIGSLHPHKRLGKHTSLIAAWTTGLACLLIWTILYKLPALSYITSFHWPSSGTLATALVGALDLSFALQCTQFTLGALVLYGFVQALRQSSLRWLAAAFCITIVQYVAAAGSEGFIKHFLTGFWYTDAYRIGANVMLVALPLACLGFDRLAGKAIMYVKENKQSLFHQHSKLSPLALALILGVIVYFPTVQITANVVKENFSTQVWTSIYNSYGDSDERVLYDPQERAFIQKVKEITHDKGMIANVPFDGSIFAYPADGLDTFYRSFTTRPTDGEMRNSEVLRRSLAQIASRPYVAKAAKELGISYVMQLDCYPDTQEGFQEAGYEEDKWKGITSITENTPGFTLVLSEGDCRLYKIDAVDQG